MFKRLCIAALVLCVGYVVLSACLWYGTNLEQRCEIGDSGACGELVLSLMQKCDNGDSEACRELIPYLQTACNMNMECYNLGISYLNEAKSAFT